jgi:hypothetical protein
MKKIFLILLILLSPCCLWAAEFDKNNIISDFDLTNYASMTLKRIDSFLTSQGGFLSTYSTTDMDGETRSAGEIIYNACQTYALSPKFMLTTLQKESSLITRTSVSDQLINYAFGFGCPDGTACSEEYKGFAKQVNAAADRIRNGYLQDLEEKNSTVSGWGVGIAKQALDGTVTPKNKATAVLYTYTPWIGYHGGEASVGGNSLFWDIWHRWFGDSDVLIYYPNGSLLQSKDTGIIYLIRNGEKMAFTSFGALVANYDINKTIAVEEYVLDQYTEGTSILFPNFTLLQAPNGAIYLYVDGKKRGISSKEIFKSLGYNPEEVIPANWKEINNIPNGSMVTETNIYPWGILLQNTKTGAIVFVDEHNRRHDIWSKDILNSRFKGVPVFEKTPDQIQQYTVGQPAKFRDGELITSPNSNSVYLIEDGKKRPFNSKKAFNELGYKWDNIITTTDDIVELHQDGDAIILPKNQKKPGE